MLRLLAEKYVTLTIRMPGQFNNKTYNIKLWKNAFSSYRKLALTVGHELSHALDWSSGNVAIWLTSQNASGNMHKWYSEYGAYKWEILWGGNFLGNTISKYNKFRSWAAPFIKEFGR